MKPATTERVWRKGLRQERPRGRRRGPSIREQMRVAQMLQAAGR
jgi:hypothetical protein